MSENPDRGGFKPPSGKNIAIGSGVALGAAIIVLVVAILPAEYCKDPTGIGGLLGITCMSSDAGPTKTIQIVDTVGGNETLMEAEIPDFGDPVPLPNPDVAQHQDAAPSTHTMVVEIDTGGETEVKLWLEEGKMAVFNWEVEGGIVYSDFHGHTPEMGDDFWVRYREDQRGAERGSGSLVAPFSGEHGWYWVNLSDNPVTVTLEATGYFDDVIDYSDAF